MDAYNTEEAEAAEERGLSWSAGRPEYQGNKVRDLLQHKVGTWLFLFRGRGTSACSCRVQDKKGTDVVQGGSVPLVQLTCPNELRDLVCCPQKRPEPYLVLAKKQGIFLQVLRDWAKKYPVRQQMARACRFLLAHRVNTVLIREGKPGAYLRAAALAAARASSDMWQGRQFVKCGKSWGLASAILVWQP